MKINKKKRVRNRKNILIVGLIIILISVSAFFFNHLRLTGFYVLEGNDIEKTIEIEVWADSLINVNFENSYIESELISDDNALIKNQEIEFYLENNLIDKQKTNSKGNAKSDFNLSKTSPGIYSLKAVFQGDSSLYLNSAEKEKQIDTTSINLTIKKENITTINLEGYECKNFTDNVLWSSGYTNSSKGSTDYQTWYPEHNCTEVGKDNCLLSNITLKTRLLHANPYDVNSIGEGYVQISEPDKSICNNPKEAKYSRYLAYDTAIEGDKAWKGQCGKNKNQDFRCGVEISNNYYGNVNCYGIKTYASQYSIIDTIEVKYALCWEN